MDSVLISLLFFFLLSEFVNPLTVIPSQQVAYKGSTTTFQCNYEGGSQEEVTWEKKDGLLPSGRHVIDKGQLNITDVGFKDEGTYVCKATIGPRVLTAEATLDVQCKFHLRQHGQVFRVLTLGS